MNWPEVKGTKILAATESDWDEAVKHAAAILQRGGLVAFPTETVYGLGADARSSAAVEKIFRAKNRPADNPLITHVTGLEQARSLVREIPPRAVLLARHFWPGPLTLVLPKSGILPHVTTAGLQSVAVRVPAHPLALSLLKAAALPVAAPSANLSGSPSPTTAEHVIADLAGRIDAILDGGDCRVGVESTVLSLLDSRPALLRPGGITLEQLVEVLGEEILDLSNDSMEFAGIPPAPGMKYRHYAPRASLYLVEAGRGQEERILSLLWELREKGIQAGLLLTAETAKVINVADSFPLEVLGSQKDPETSARLFYGALRRLDSKGVDAIIAEGVSEKEMGRALMNRLRKAAASIITAPEAQHNKKENICRVLFVCTGNTCRSVMAESLFRRHWEDRGAPWKLEVFSAGLFTPGNQYASREALELLQREALDMKAHRSRPVEQKMIDKAHFVFTMTAAHKKTILERFSCGGKVWILGEYGGTGKDIADPYGGGRDAYELAAQQIKKAFHGVTARLEKELNNKYESRKEKRDREENT